MRVKTVCFIGEMIIPKDKREFISDNLFREIQRCIFYGGTDFICGGEPGFDSMAAKIILKEKAFHKNLRLILALQYKNQEAPWTAEQRAEYKYMLSKADEVIYLSEYFSHGCIKRQSRFMVQSSDYCICCLINEKSETDETVRMAYEKGLELVNTADEECARFCGRREL